MLGTPGIRGSASTAIRSARAVALKMASLTWWLLRPWCSTTCRLHRALAAAANCLCNLHVIAHYGRNSHHIAEAIFKATARALRMAIEIDPRAHGVPSTKGTLSG